MNKTRSLAAMVSAIAFSITYHAAAQTTIAPEFARDYSFVDLGSAPMVPANYGGLTLKIDDSNVLLLGGAANGGGGAIYSIGVLRDINSHIFAFTGSGTLFATAPNIDGGLAYGPNDVLFYTGYPINTLGQIKPGSTSPDKVINLSGLGVASSVGTVAFATPTPAPARPGSKKGGEPGGAAPVLDSIRLLSFNSGDFYSGVLSPDGSGTFNLSGIAQRTNTGSGPEGLIFVGAGAPDFPKNSVLISEYNAGRISAYEVDSSGIPIPATRRDFITGLTGSEGAFTDPLTQDFLFSTYGGGNRVIAVRGFAVAPCTPPPTGMLAWYPGDGNPFDIQGPTFENGTLQGNTSYAPGIVQRAFAFDGSNDYVQILDAPALRPQQLTVDAWVYARSAGDTNDAQGGIIFTKDLGSSSGAPVSYALFGPGNTGKFNAQLRFTDGTTAGVFSTSSFAFNGWHHVAMTWDGTTLRLYVDGLLEGSVAPSGGPKTIIYTNNDAAIGRHSHVDRSFDGFIDEVELFDHALTAAEIQEIVNARTSGKCRTCTPPPANLIAWLTGDFTPNDRSGNGNNGILQNGTTYAPGLVDAAFNFDGVDDQITIPHQASQNTGSQITIDAWVYPTALSHGRTIFQKRTTSNVGGYVLESAGSPFAPDNSLQFVISIGGTYRTVIANSVLTLNTWQHVAATYDGANMRIFVNGVQAASMAQTGAIDAVSDPVVIGHNVVNGQNWQGLLDEIELLNRALSAAEVRALVNAGNAGKCKNCPTITFGALPTSGTVNSPYNGSAAASPAGTYTYSVSSGALPPGLSLNTSTGAVTGTPATTNGSPFNFTVTAADAGGCSGSQSYSITINCPPTLISPSSLPGGTLNTAYSQSVSASGTGGSYSFSVTGGTLPPGLTLATGGNISGTPNLAGTFSFTVTATDINAGCSGTMGYSIVIVCPTISLSALPNGTVGTAYSGSAAASPAGTYSYMVSAGALPSGLNLDPSTGAVTGTPTTSNGSPFSFTITATTSNCTGSRAYSVTVSCPTIVVNPSTLPDGTVGAGYSQQLSATGTSGTFTFMVTGGSLPPGLTLSTSGLLSGTPTAANSFSFTVTATNSSAVCSGSQAYSVTINAQPTPTPSPTPSPSPSPSPSPTPSPSPSPNPSPSPSPNECMVCHKGIITLILPCNSLEYQRHLDHGDLARACSQ